jgi:hypothetical protein
MHSLALRACMATFFLARVIPWLWIFHERTDSSGRRGGAGFVMVGRWREPQNGRTRLVG